MPAKAPPRALVTVLAVLALGAPALGAPADGWWVELGEDGAIWVPAEPPASPAYLPPPDLGAYRNVTETVLAVQAVAAARPDLVAVSQVGASVEGRPILKATVTAPGDPTGRARVLFDGAHHGDEVIASEILVRWLEGVASGYDTNATMQAILAQVVVDVVPQVNPDGVNRASSCSYYGVCRKNTNGVDLNRNYADHWGGVGSSGSPSSDVYRGPAPMSEPETQAIGALLDQHDYALYASLHSGAEMILWPLGWTTSPPAEENVFKSLGNELTSATGGVPNGQVSKILYGVSGDAMDQAYGSAANWRSLPVSPETYKGSGSAYDWWLLFNPSETNAAIQPVVDKWLPFLWHMAKEAPNFRPGILDAPASVIVGPDPGSFAATATAAVRRPFLGANVLLVPGAAPVQVTSPNPVPLANAAGPQTVQFGLAPQALGAAPGLLRLQAGPAGKVERALTIESVQLGLQVSVAKPVMGTPEANSATVLVDAGPFDAVTGTLQVRLDPEGLVVASQAVSVVPGSPFQATFPFNATALASGAHAAVADLTFNATLGGTAKPGQTQVQAPFTVVRPDIALTKSFVTVSQPGQALKVTSVYKNLGAWPAEGLVARERVPPGYTYWVRDGPVPVPPNPLGSPMPTSVELGDDGSVWLVYSLGGVPAGQAKALQYGLLPLLPGAHDLTSAWAYGGTFPSGSATYAGEAHAVHYTGLS